MTDQIIAFLVKYQEMRATQIEYFKTRDKRTLGKSKQLELQLDREAMQIKAALTIK